MSFQNVPPKAGAPTTTQEGGPPPSAPQGPPGGPLMTFLPFLIFIPLIFMMWRRQKKEEKARGMLKRGDRVVSNGGLIGELVDVQDRIAKVKIASGTTVEMLASTISAYVPESSAAKEPAKALAEKK